MRNNLRRLTVLVAYLLLSHLVLANAQDGEELYAQKLCDSCHGTVGQGGAAPVVLFPSPLTLEAFTAIVRRPYNVMPAYAPAVLSDAEIESIFQYLESLPDPVDPDSIPALAAD